MSDFLDNLRTIVEHPIFILLGFSISIFSLIMTFDKPREWFEHYSKIPKISRNIWQAILLAWCGLAIIIVYIQFGISSTLLLLLAFVAIALGLSFVKEKNKSKILEQEITQAIKITGDHKALLAYIYELHKTKFCLNYWHLTYSIESSGSVHTREKLAILPIENGGKVYFRQSVLGLATNVPGIMILENLKVTNSRNGKELRIIEINSDSRRLEYAIILDPPATIRNPAEIEIESYRPAVFKPLVDELHDYGEILIAGNPTEGSLTIIAPPELEITSLDIQPEIGQVDTSQMGELSIATWKGTSITNGLYAYSIQARRKGD